MATGAALATGGVAAAAEPPKSSFDPKGVSMFRGSPSHTHYGTGPLKDKLEVAWRFKTEVFRTELHGKPYTWTGSGWSGQAVQVDDRVIFGSVDRNLYCLNKKTGKQIWKHSATRMFKSSAAFYDNKVYIGNVDNNLRCVDANTGKVLWKHYTRADMDSSPMVSDGRLYVGGEDLSIYCFDPQTGDKLWRHRVDERGRSRWADAAWSRLRATTTGMCSRPLMRGTSTAWTPRPGRASGDIRPGTTPTRHRC